MDYDQTTMPSVYEAGRGYAPEVLEFWLSTIAAPLAGDHIADILDLGCGTGRYSAALAAHFGAQVVGVEPSEKMLREARRGRKGGHNVRFLRRIRARPCAATVRPLKIQPRGTSMSSLLKPGTWRTSEGG